MNAIEDLLPIIVFILIGVVSSIIQKKQKRGNNPPRPRYTPVAPSRPQQPEPSSAPLLERIREVLETIQAPPLPVEVEPVPLPRRMSSEVFAGPEESASLEEGSLETAGEHDTHSLEEDEIISMPGEIGSESAARAYQQSPSAATHLSRPTGSWREAVVLSEILAPPLALRNE